MKLTKGEAETLAESRWGDDVFKVEPHHVEPHAKVGTRKVIQQWKVLLGAPRITRPGQRGNVPLGWITVLEDGATILRP